MLHDRRPMPPNLRLVHPRQPNPDNPTRTGHHDPFKAQIKVINPE
jgi:hypothetical protein